jgi:hypothetical protein
MWPGVVQVQAPTSRVRRQPIREELNMEHPDTSEYRMQDPTTDPNPGAVGTVLEEAREQARSVADTAMHQTRGALATIGSDLSAEAHSQKLRLAKGLDEFSSELDQVALNGTGRVPSLAGEAADRTRSLSRWLENTDTVDMVRSVEDFGRRRPAMFILGSAVAGVVAGRLTRGMIDDRSHDSDSADRRAPAPTTVLPAGSAAAGAGSTYGAVS